MRLVSVDLETDEGGEFLRITWTKQEAIETKHMLYALGAILADAVAMWLMGGDVEEEETEQIMDAALAGVKTYAQEILNGTEKDAPVITAALDMKRGAIDA